ncbi:MAG TPA: ACP synthase, partial [Clostridiaceae bacterium]|nr:ACP synthase [Clostridiaceae bacterium]
GLPCVALKGLPFLKGGLLRGLSLNDSMVQSLIGIMSLVEDTTVISRHNTDVLYNFVHIKAKEALDLGGMFTKEGKEAITGMDKLFIEKNVSPGGAADLLAVTYAIYDIENKYKK